MEHSLVIKSLGALVGEAYVLSGEQDREKYDCDWTGKWKGESLAVVRPSNTSEVADVIKFAYEHDISVVPQSGNTGIAGGAYPGQDKSQIILSLDRMNKIIEINTNSHLAIVEAGVVLQELHQTVEEYGLIFPLTFGAQGSCMIGGNLATNAGGSNVVRYGNTRDLCMGLEVVTPDGRILNLMSQLHKDNTGYSLKNLYIGSEGTLGVITSAVLKLFPMPKAYATALVAIPSVDAALNLLNRFQEATRGSVEAFELMPHQFIELVTNHFDNLSPPFDQPMEYSVLIEIGAVSPEDVAPQEDGSIPVMNLLESLLEELFEEGEVLDAVIAQSEEQRKTLWSIREGGLEAILAKGRPIISDIAVPLDKVQRFIDEMESRLAIIAPNSEYSVIAHLGDGNLHYGIWPNVLAGAEWDPILESEIVEEIEVVIKELSGTFSAEHGIGCSKTDTMERMKDIVALDVMWQIKQSLDPKNLMNPGKLLPCR
ncbi:FAD-binding oxidoreductase [Neptunomonas sp. XY-337]|uniref:FAD-binding oxidoreductase n=1 Tax=Neptunomonas sp. XY-337 TaxID=2561897 RepID=UPI0010AA9611|nr:FAD-binding oxidoreductase [Neptunomonas sp. XY-337]